MAWEGLALACPAAVLLWPGGESSSFPWHAGGIQAVPQLAPPLAQSAWFFAFGIVHSIRFLRSGGIPFGVPIRPFQQLGWASVSWGA